MIDMSRRPQIVWGLLLAAAWGSFWSVPQVAAATPMRAMILFDTSGSMRKNDPHRLSRVAAQLFLELTGPHDQVGLIAFSDDGVPLLPLTTLSSPAVKKPFLAKLRALRFNGQTTDLGAALQAGLASFSEQSTEDSRDLVLLLTDGKLDLGAPRRAEEPLALAYIRETLLPQYQERGIAVYTIAFTAAADRALLQEMAQGTAGEFRFIPSAKMLHKAFSELFVLAQQAESIPMQDGTVLLDASIQEASLILSKAKAQEPLALVTPQQQRLHAGSTHPGVHWNSTPSYDLVRLTKPEPGSWQVVRSSGHEDDMAIIGASSLRLQVELSPEYLESGEPFTIHARLLENGQPTHDPQHLRGLVVQAEITTPEGKRFSVPLQPQAVGEFAASLAVPEVAGQYGLVLTAASPTLRRQRALSFIPQPRCFEPSVVADPPVTVRITLTEACPFWRKLTLQARYVPDQETGQNDQAWLRLESSKPRVFQATLPVPQEEGKQVMIRIRGSRGGKQSFTIMRGPLPLPQLPPPEMVWSALAKTVGLQLLGINVVLGVGGAGGYRVYRSLARRKKV